MEKIIIPSVSSENRNYMPIGFLDNKTIVSNAAFALYDAPSWLFGILTSAMHMVWVKTVGGRLKTDYRYSAQLCYNTFPFPKISAAKKKEIADAAEDILVTREFHVGKTLAELYDPEKMPKDLATIRQVNGYLFCVLIAMISLARCTLRQRIFDGMRRTITQKDIPTFTCSSGRATLTSRTSLP